MRPSDTLIRRLISQGVAIPYGSQFKRTGANRGQVENGHYRWVIVRPGLPYIAGFERVSDLLARPLKAQYRAAEDAVIVETERENA